MNRLRAFAVIGATALVTLAGVDTAFAWPVGSITIKAVCENHPGRVSLKVHDSYSKGTDFTLTNSNTSESLTGYVKGRSTAEKVVPYTGPGVVWTVKIITAKKEVITSSVTLGEEKACRLSPSPSPTPTVKPSPSPTHSATATPTSTPKPTAKHPATPSPSPSRPAPTKQLAHTGMDNLALTLGGSALLLCSGLAGAYYTRRARRRA